MQATFVSFPGGSKHVTLEGVTATLRQILTEAGVTHDPGEKADLAINNEITTNLDAEVPDGATVTKTKRVVGG